MDRGNTRLDVITIGRASVDLYGQQIGSRLEDVSSFAKSVGGCPANIAIGSARLGLRSALLTRVGDEQMGRFIREQMVREGVATDGLITDRERLTALAILSVQDDRSFPLLFYRENCADMALCEDDVDAAFIASARAIVVTGTHFSRPGTEAAQRKAMQFARTANAKIVLDIDYRPNLWGLAGHADGESRFISSAAVTEKMMSVLADCDLIVGTEEEISIASGKSELLSALRTIRTVSDAVIVLKRGPMGCIVYDGPIPEDLQAGIVGEGFPIEVYNVLGAGDAFMSGFLRGWLGGESLEVSATWANACGAFAVSRLLCSPESPSFEELQYYLSHGSAFRALRKDEAINHVHWATTRRKALPSLLILAIDHRRQFNELAQRHSAGADKISAFKILAVEAAARVAAGRTGFGILIDATLGREALFEAARFSFDWIGRPVEQQGSRPLRFEHGSDAGSELIEWPVNHCVKVLCHYHPSDPFDLKRKQQAKLCTLFEASRKVGRELLIEIVSGGSHALEEDTAARVLDELYDAGVKPDWWKLEAQPSTGAWALIEAVIAERDPWCRGVLMLGQEASIEQIEAALASAASVPLVKGFAIGRAIFREAAEGWFAGQLTDETATRMMAERFDRLSQKWLALKAHRIDEGEVPWGSASG
jgi:5-dehydro-2-deoxygluconokinase